MLQNQHPVRRWKQRLVLPVLGGLFLAACQSASDQPAPNAKQTSANATSEMAPPPPPPPKLTTLPSVLNSKEYKLYTYVDEMPHLPNADGVGPIVKQIQDSFVRPAGPHQEGMVFASFTVNEDGSVSDTKIVKGLSPAYDEAVLAAIQKLPRFVPGKQSGKAVNVSFTVPMKFVEEKP